MTFIKKLFNKNKSDRTNGGIRKVLDKNLPKYVNSTEIVGFECDFYKRAAISADKDVLDGEYRLTCEKIGEKICCRYSRKLSRNGNVDKIFDGDENLLISLEKAVREENIARLNGLETFVSGLPRNYGAKLSVRYSSGESIETSNNQQVDLPSTAIERFVKIFESYI